MGQTDQSFTLIITKKQCVIDESEDLSYFYLCDSLFYRRNLGGGCAPFDPEPFYNFALGGIIKRKKNKNTDHRLKNKLRTIKELTNYQSGKENE